MCRHSRIFKVGVTCTACEEARYPRIVESGRIEVAAPRNGRPGYRWVTGWAIEYSATHRTVPMRLAEARAYLRDLKEA